MYNTYSQKVIKCKNVFNETKYLMLTENDYDVEKYSYESLIENSFYFMKEDLIGITINTLRNSFKNKHGLFYDKNINPNSFELVEIKETKVEKILIEDTENEILDTIKGKLIFEEYEYVKQHIPPKDKTKKDEKCCFEKSWVGVCNEVSFITINGKHFCKKHSQIKCSKCGKQATQECEQTLGAFVCGAPLCDDCKCH